MRQRHITFGILIAAIFAYVLPGCMNNTAPPPREAEGTTQMKFTFDRANDPRTYSVGTVLMRAFDIDGNLLVASTPFESNRETGLFEFDFTVPGGVDRVVVAEPRGSGFPPGGGKTESGIALQGRDTLDIPIGGRADSIVINLKPFIPDSLEVIGDFDLTDDTLKWKKMEIATSHIVRYEEFSDSLVDWIPFVVERGPENFLPLSEIRSRPRSNVSMFQVASVNDISTSAFSDTAFYPFMGGGGGHPLSGRVVDATTGQPVAGATVTVEGPVTRSATTNEEGEYVIPDLPDGNYTTTVERDGFVIDETTIEMAGAAAESDVILSPSLGADQFRAVLSWGEFPRDIDSHIFLSNGAHIYFSNVGSAVDSPFVNLDVDDRSSYGPETITISQLTSNYQYAVYNWSGETDLIFSEAVVRLYRGDTLVRTYAVPSSGDGRWWYVFDIDSGGNITDRNFITTTFPAKPTGPGKPGTGK